MIGKISLLLVVVVAVCNGQTEKGNANFFVDMLLDNMRKNTDTPLEPYDFPEQSMGFERKLLLVTWKGEIKLRKTVITGLSTLHRTDDCSLSFDDGAMLVAARLGMGVLNLRTTADIKFMNLGPTVSIAAKVGFADVDLGLEIKTATPGSKPRLTKFALKDLKGLEVQVTNLGPLKYLVNFLSGLITNLLRRTVKFVTEKIMRGVIQKYLNEADLPIF